AAILVDRLARDENGRTEERLCRGPLLSRAQYLVDVEQWGYQDARLRPRGAMSAEQVGRWTAGIDTDQPGVGIPYLPAHEHESSREPPATACTERSPKARG